MKRRIFIVSLWVIILGLLSSVVSLFPSAFAQEEEALLLFKEMPMVVSASREATLLSEAPSAMFVITAEDIKQSGATALPEVLRMAPGINVVQVTATSYSVGVRDINKIPYDLVLVMIDGQVIYSDHQGETEWSGIPITLEEIERIEVVRSAGSVLYGANAYSGVINIITKKTDATKGTLISATNGSEHTALETIVHGGRYEKIGYRISASYDRQDQWKTNAVPWGESKDMHKTNVVLEYDIDKESKLTTNVGYSDGTAEIANPNGVYLLDNNEEWLLTGLRYERPDLSAMVYRRHINRYQPNFFYSPPFAFPGAKLWQDMLAFELQHTLHLNLANLEHTFIWGVGANRKVVSAPTVQKGTKQDQDQYSVFFQDEFKPGDNLTVYAGLRLDTHEIAGSQLSPRISLVYSPLTNHYFKASWSRAFRVPTFNEALLEYYPFPGYLAVQGNEALDAMTKDSFDIGYSMPITEKVKAEITLFYSLLKNYIERAYIGDWLGNPLFPMFQYANANNDAKSYGGELGLNFLILPWLNGMANYSYADVVETESNPSISWRTDQTPQHKFNLGLRAKQKNLSANLLMSYVSTTNWDYGGWGGGKASAYTIVNGRVGYIFCRDKAEIALCVQNLFKDNHYEYPAINIGRRIYGTLSYKF